MIYYNLEKDSIGKWEISPHWLNSNDFKDYNLEVYKSFNWVSGLDWRLIVYSLEKDN